MGWRMPELWQHHVGSHSYWELLGLKDGAVWGWSRAEDIGMGQESLMGNNQGRDKTAPYKYTQWSSLCERKKKLLME